MDRGLSVDNPTDLLRSVDHVLVALFQLQERLRVRLFLKSQDSHSSNNVVKL